MPKEYIVCRVDREPILYYQGQTDWGHAAVTAEKTEALLMTLDGARDAVFLLQIDRGGVWGVRKA